MRRAYGSPDVPRMVIPMAVAIIKGLMPVQQGYNIFSAPTDAVGTVGLLCGLPSGSGDDQRWPPNSICSRPLLIYIYIYTHTHTRMIYIRSVFASQNPTGWRRIYPSTKLIFIRYVVLSCSHNTTVAIIIIIIAVIIIKRFETPRAGHIVRN